MPKHNVLITGASGFIGTHLAQRLTSQGHQVTCLVRKSSKVDALKTSGCKLVYGDLTDSKTLKPAVAGQDMVYHLAASTRALNSEQLMRVNVDGTKYLLDVCRQQETSTPTVVLVSSLAATGPSGSGQPRTESDFCQPVSQYGISKKESEAVARQFSNHLPITIVRPPIVLGANDPDGLTLFRAIDRSGIHLMPGFGEDHFSIIHVDDLVESLILAAENGERLSAGPSGQGIYFVSADEIVSYRELGQMVATALGREKVRIWRTPYFVVRLIAALGSCLGQLTRKPRYLNLDKAREVVAGSWTCSSAKIKDQLGFAPSRPLAERLKQTAQWYQQHGWLGPGQVNQTDSQTRSADQDHRDMVTP